MAKPEFARIELYGLADGQVNVRADGKELGGLFQNGEHFCVRLHATVVRSIRPPKAEE